MMTEKIRWLHQLGRSSLHYFHNKSVKDKNKKKINENRKWKQMKKK